MAPTSTRGKDAIIPKVNDKSSFCNDFAQLDKPTPTRDSGDISRHQNARLTGTTAPDRVNKSVGTKDGRVRKDRPTVTVPELTRDEEVRRSASLKTKKSTSSIASQDSHYKGDSDFEDDDFMREFYQIEEKEQSKGVAQMEAKISLDETCESSTTAPPSRTTSLSSVMTVSTAATSPFDADDATSSFQRPDISIHPGFATGSDHRAATEGIAIFTQPPSSVSPPSISTSTNVNKKVEVANLNYLFYNGKREPLHASPVDAVRDLFNGTGSGSKSAQPISTCTKDIKCSATNASTSTRSSVLRSTPAVSSTAIANASVTCSPPFHIAYSAHVQRMMDSRQIAWGVQYEIARGVTHRLWSWEDVTVEKLDVLRGSNAEVASHVADVLQTQNETPKLPKNSASHDLSVYHELDREQAAIMENSGRGLGFQGNWKGKVHWYGGKVQQVARLSLDPKVGVGSIASRCVIRLEKLEQRRSYRFARYLGSRRILQLRCPKELVTKEWEKVIEFVSQKLVLCGRVFSPFHSKDHTVYLVETGDHEQRAPSEHEGDHFRLTFDKFLDWHNPLYLNAAQPISKWSTRWALGLSTSIPVLEFLPGDIHFIGDKYATVDLARGKARAEQIMTDGCGYINQAALAAIANVMSITSLPMAVQGRIAGAKGMWVLHPDPEHRNLQDSPKIWIRDSQDKIKLGDLATLGRAHRIFDLVRLPRITSPGSLYMQTIENMANNKVEDKVFKGLMEQSLRDQIDPLTRWEGDHANAELFKAVESAGRVIGSRLGRGASLSSRALGFIRDEDSDSDEDDADLDDDHDGGNQNLVDRSDISGCPSVLSEQILEMLQAGFTPLTSSFLRDKLKALLKQIANSCLSKYHITVSLSAEAFIIPDPFGVLEEGEIHFRTSQPIGDNTRRIDPHTFVGAVLLTRNPTRVASDVQKVMAVSHDQLTPYVDVIVCSIKGIRSLASWLGGGDYDGDTVTVIAEPSLVEGFCNAAFTKSPDDLEQCFEKNVETVTDFTQRVDKMIQPLREQEYHKILLLGLFDTKVGLYSLFHDNAVFKNGYDHPDAVRMAYMFMTCLDSGKTGLRVKTNVFKRDQGCFGGERPSCMKTPDETIGAIPSRDPPPKRALGLGVFILDALREHGMKVRDDMLIQYESLNNNIGCHNDQDLKRPLEEYEKHAQNWLSKRGDTVLLDELRLIKDHVESMFCLYRKQVGSIFKKSSEVSKKTKSGPNSHSISVSRRKSVIVRDLAKSFADDPAGLSFTYQDSIPHIKASYAYLFAARHKGILASSFPFDMAHRDLCLIKAQPKGFVTSTTDFADMKTMHGTLLNARARSRDDS